MKKFSYSSPTKIYFGKDQIESIELELEAYKNQAVLLVYGRSSIKTNGIYDVIVKLSKKLNITLVEESNVAPNPDVTSVRSGIEKCKKHQVAFVLAAGGGSVIDCAKAIAFGVNAPCDVWAIYNRTCDAVDALPLGVIITLAATGTETNGNSVISNRELDQKRAVAYPFSIPTFAIIDPGYTLSVNRHHTVAGGIDIIMHILEQYFSKTTRTETSDYMSIGVIRSVIENLERILDGTDDYDTRANLSWASTIGLNWILGVDKQGDWATHRLSYVLTKEYGTTHGYALLLLFISWLKVALKYNKEAMTPKLALLGEELFGVEEPMLVINNLEAMFNEFGANTNFIDEGIVMDKQKMKELIENALELGSVGTVVTIDHEKATEVFMLSNRR